MRKLAVFFELTNGRGNYELEIKCVFAKTDEAVFGASGPVDFPDPRSVARMNFNFGNTLFAREGEYRFQVWCEGELLTERRFVVKTLPKPETQE